MKIPLTKSGSFTFENITDVLRIVDVLAITVEDVIRDDCQPNHLVEHITSVRINFQDAIGGNKFSYIYTSKHPGEFYKREGAKFADKNIDRKIIYLRSVLRRVWVKQNNV